MDPECKSTASVDVNTVILSIDYCSNGEKTVVNNALLRLETPHCSESRRAKHPELELQTASSKAHPQEKVYLPGTIPVCKNWMPFATPIAAVIRCVQRSIQLFDANILNQNLLVEGSKKDEFRVNFRPYYIQQCKNH
ncbi:hypothetical protein CFP56_014125 [Quercus suber]|uniref:Uncharacterized protein n=1 Tax=Quercus suber TaxID=58331 RepID=A0AAW0KSV1_QUESU